MNAPLRLSALALVFATTSLHAQRPALSSGVRAYVRVDTPVIALTHVRIIDGTGSPARADQTVLVRDGRIAAIGAAGSVSIPPGAQVLDLAGKSVIPGLVMVHEHLYYPTTQGVYAYLAESFTRLYLAGGVTAMRTGGNLNGFGELAIKHAIDAGEKPGPWLDATAPYLEGAGLGLLQVHELADAAEARSMVGYWADRGATSFKAYMHITRAELSAAIDEIHKRGMKLTGHLCSITYREAAELGIDNLEHGFFAATDFVANKQPDACPDQATRNASLAQLDSSHAALKALVRELVARRVAVTSTLTVFETLAQGQPKPPGLDVLEQGLRAQFEQRWTSVQQSSGLKAAIFARLRALEVAFARAGGLLLVGTDPTGYGGVIPGYSNQRALELLVQSGFTPLEAIRIGTLNGAKYLGRDAVIGTIAVGKQADLVVVAGDPSARIEDVRNVEIVFRQGVGYDPEKLIASVRGRVGVF